MKVTLDKIASTTRNARIPREVLLSDEIQAKEGMVLAVRVHGKKTVYNTLEDIYGRMIDLNDGDIIAAVLGTRRALRGYAGHVPESIKVGDKLDILNLGGVIGRCTSVNLEIGKPLQAEVLGQILSFPHLGERVGVPASIRTGAVAWSDKLEKSAPIIYVAGTCMNAGKTFACGEIIRFLARKGYRVGAAKLTGVSLLRDTMSMVDRGAIKGLSFTDAGVVSTTGAVSVPVAKGLINALNKEEPDCLVIELGDGIMGEYGVQEILKDPELMQAASAHVMCANDPVSAWGAVELFTNRFKLKVDVLSGPATDNAVGKEFIEGQVGVKAINARIEAEALGQFVEKAVFGGVPA
ncbi:MAG: hypothetical protein Q8T11_01790 [Elusimicrobiota bacterium]|nr:hypothetical protein [Elusimicrobiota bacterium]